MADKTYVMSSEEDTSESSTEWLENIGRNRRASTRHVLNVPSCVSHVVSSPSPPPRSRVYRIRVICNSSRRRNGVSSTVSLPSSSIVNLTSNHTRPTSSSSPDDNNENESLRPTGKRVPWTKDDYKELIWCYYQTEVENLQSEKNVFWDMEMKKSKC